MKRFLCFIFRYCHSRKKAVYQRVSCKKVSKIFKGIFRDVRVKTSFEPDRGLLNENVGAVAGRALLEILHPISELS